MIIEIAKISAVISAVAIFWAKVKNVYKKLSPLIEPFIKDAEQRAKDGLIDKKDRKELAMLFISTAQAQGKLRKFGFFERIIVSKVVDWIAKKLPDFQFTVKA